MVAPALRGLGVGEAVVRLLLDHPGVRGARSVHLGTQDAHTIYARSGFPAPRGPAAAAVHVDRDGAHQDGVEAPEGHPPAVSVAGPPRAVPGAAPA
ncbi:hypothetical protein [Sorangium sp. So ce176]|uniref:hypothetical protein n=1 Tax=Sorangium sp. So ce176 TaxID=3133286 RepID=UPI003F5F58DE